MRNSRLALAIAGSRASDTRSQAPLRPQRRPPQPQYPGQLTPLSSFFAEVICDAGASPPRTAALPPRTAASLPANGGELHQSRRDTPATRRREASNAAKPPSPARDTPRRSGRRFGEYGRASRHGPSYGTRGQCPDNLQTNVARNSPRSLFEITRKRCNSNDVDSTFELIARELRATLMGGGKAWPSIETTLVVDEVVHPIGKSQPT